MHEVKMPQMGQSVEEASIVQWIKKEGDTVAQGEPLFTIQTDKAEVECEAPAAGVLRKILLQPDVMVPVLTVVALIGDSGEPLPDLGRYGAGASSPAAPVEAAPVSVPASAASAAPSAPGQAFVSPRARAKAAELGVDPSAIPGTGAQGRVIEADVLAHADRAASVRATPVARRVAEIKGVDLGAVQGTGIAGKVTKSDVLVTATPQTAAPKPLVPATGAVRIPLTPMRRIIAQRMSESKFMAPHYYITVEIDMSEAKAFRKAVKHFTPSFNDFVLCAAVKALREFPAVNARWAGDAIEQLPDVNLGVAVALPAGLIVPVLRQAQSLSLEGISAQAKALVEKARNGKLLPDDYIGNTFTVSNLGPYGVDHFTAIINQPDSAIMAVGQMKDRPAVVDGGIFIRPLMKVTLSSDHRVIDGAIAAQFMSRFKEILEEADF